LQSKILNLRRFWRFLAERGQHLSKIEDVTADLLDRYEDWLEQITRSGVHHRQLLSPIIDFADRRRTGAAAVRGQSDRTAEYSAAWKEREFAHETHTAVQ